ncbi:MAG: pyrroline-5-carboxylate reductase [Syntrophorhabdaceae bacterium]|nr:pyrroline-5-carboxylate reductase [Syntrophorhabdaceae bacterium]
MEKIGIIGLGNMGEAILKALIKAGYKTEDIAFYELKKERVAYIEGLYRVFSADSPEGLAKESRYLIVAVKPQDARQTLIEIAPYIDEKNVIISIMAGIKISNILSVFHRPIKIIRAMPNICAKVGEAATGIAAGKGIEDEELKDTKEIFSCLGSVIEVGEELMDAITALAGSGPAFFLFFLEAMIDAGVKMGIPREKSKAMSIQVIKGTLKMLEEEDVHPSILREMVTSPGGTTITGLTHLEKKAFKGSIITAIEKAAKRAGELSSWL